MVYILSTVNSNKHILFSNFFCLSHDNLLFIDSKGPLCYSHSKVSLRTIFPLSPLLKVFPESWPQPSHTSITFLRTCHAWLWLQISRHTLSWDVSPETATPKRMPSRPLYLNLTHIYYIQNSSSFLLSFFFLPTSFTMFLKQVRSY